MTSSALFDFESFTFSECGATGATGPTLDQCRTQYAVKQGLSWPIQYVTMKTQGVQEFTIPVDATYKITAAGAQGGSTVNTYGSYIMRGGSGRIISHTMSLKRGSKLMLVVGQKGATQEYQTGGGGGTFVYETSISKSNVRLVAGGGGGGSKLNDGNTISGLPASSSSSGTNGFSCTNASGVGGTEGAGGKGGASYTVSTSYPPGASGTNLAGGSAGKASGNYCGGGGGMGVGDTGATFLGGSFDVNSIAGGFGGGGGVMPGAWNGAGGGGGYSGGGGGGVRSTSGGCAGGGGGTYSFDGKHVDMGAINEGHGYITIELLQVATPAPTTPAPTTRAPTPAPTLAPTSAAPVTPSPTPAPVPPPTYLRYPPNFVILVHEGEWMTNGTLKVMTLRGSTPSLQSFTYKDLSQVFAIDANGSVRTVSGQGEYVNHATNCDGVVGGSSPSKWRFMPRNLPRSYTLEVECANTSLGTKRVEFNTLVNPWALFLGNSTGAQGGWFIVPVARADG